MSRPLFPESNLTKIARERGSREQLERRPAPAAAEAAAGSDPWPMSYDLMPWDAAKRGIDGYDFNPTRDSAYLGGFYVEGNGDGDIAIMYFRLGPRGSAWGLNFECDRGSDCGIVHTSWQVVSEDSGALGNGAGFEGGLGLIFDSYAGAAPTFYTADSPSFDLYNAAPSLHQNFDGYSQFRIMGQEGDLITANATTNADDPFFKHFDGGPGIWACKVMVNGKNASSSGYRVRIENAFVRRWTVGGNPTG